MIKVYIYILIDPVTNEIRYVGKTVNPKGRLSKHLYWSALNNTEYKSNWIKKLKKMDLSPKMDIVQEVNEIYWKECEIYWISYFKGIGCPLTNTDTGGLGQPRGYKPSKKSIEKMLKTRMSNGGYNPSKESIQKGIETRRKNGTLNHSTQTRVKMSRATKNRKPISEETRKRMSESHIGIKQTKEQQLKKSITIAKKKKVNSVSGFKGVSWNEQKLKWRSRFNDKHIGMFDDRIDAAIAYDEVLLEKFGVGNCTTNKDLCLY